MNPKQHQLATPVADRVAGIGRSATVAMLDQVRSLRAEGVDVLDLSGGEPDFATPAHIANHAAAAMADGFTHYTPGRGLPQLVQAIAGKLRDENDVCIDPSAGLVVTPSAKTALFQAMMTLLNPGDEVLIPSPSWVSYHSMASLVGAVPVDVPLNPADGFEVTGPILERHLTSRTKAIVINSPNNPTGRVMTASEAAVIARFASEHDLWIIADEIYEKVIYDGRRHISLASLAECSERTLTINGFSKGYAMTGWRLGYVAGPLSVLGELLKIQEHTVGCAGSFIQLGGLAALTGPQECVQEMAAEYAARRDIIVSRFDAIPGISCAAPQGSFYVFPDVRGTGFASSAAFARWVLSEVGVAVTPGSAFGTAGEGHVRLSFATSRDVLEEAVGRIAGALSRRAQSFSDVHQITGN